jgi:hypothetical protein
MNSNLSYTPDFSDQGTVRFPVAGRMFAEQKVRYLPLVTQATTSMPIRFSFNAPSLKTVLLANLHSSSYRLNSFLEVELEKTVNGVVVSDPKTGAYGAGANEMEAVKDFQSMLFEMFEQLSEQEQNLSKALSNKLRYFRSMISSK